MATVPPERLERPTEETARLLSMAWLDEADQALDRLADPEDEEALHDFRVSLRRFRSCVRAYQPYLKGSAPKKARKRMGNLASATNAGRDAEVQITWLESQAEVLTPRERKGLRWLVARLEARRDESYAEAQAQITAEFRTLRRRVCDRLSSYTLRLGPGDAPAYRPFVEVTGELLDEQAATFRSLLATVHTPQDEEQAHNSRIAAKRLRYLLEPLTKSVDGVKPLIKRLKRLQDILGELHDTHVLSTEIAEAIETVAAERARRLHELALEAQSSSGRSRRSPGDETRGLLALTRLLRERRDELFSALQHRWLGQKSDDFFQKVTGLALRLRHGGHDQHEVERRYLLSEVPDSLRDTASSVLISQGWLPGDVLQERLRRVRSPEGLRYYRTVKSGSGLNRVQLEEKISRRSFERLWPLTEGRRLRKRRYRRADAQLSWEIDEFLDRELVLAEVGLPSEDYPVQPPDWLQPYVVEEVTGDPAYENANLATRRPRSSPGRRSTPRPSPRPDPPD